MENKYQNIAKEKTTEDLIGILLNKEEYKSKLVESAEQELKKRKEKDSLTKPTLPTSPVSNTVNLQNEKPPGIYVAAIILFLFFPIWIFIAILQAGLSGITDDTGLGFLAIWNAFFAIASIVIAIGILQLEEWGYKWGLVSAIVNVLLFGYSYATEQSLLFAFFAVAEIIVAVSLYVNRSYFIPRTEPIQSTDIEAPQNYEEEYIDPIEKQNREYHQNITTLHKLIRKEKNSLFGSSKKQEIINLLSDLCTTKENADYLLITYDQQFHSDLVADIKKLTNSYDSMKQYLSPLIEIEIIEENFPHDRIKG